ncbi:MAG: hypothetical protein IIV17_05150 [Clostridia bacterium]|nr:hypothetical protein [Clostridia bacterium]
MSSAKVFPRLFLRFAQKLFGFRPIISDIFAFYTKILVFFVQNRKSTLRAIRNGGRWLPVGQGDEPVCPAAGHGAKKHPPALAGAFGLELVM